MADFKVLVPLDGSRTAEHSLVYLEALKRLGAGTIELLSVADDSEDFHGELSDEATEREANLLGTYLREVSHDVKSHLGVDVESRVVRGAPAACVAEEIESTRPDLLVITTHGRTGAARWRMGSVADKVIRGATCNTLVIGPKAHEAEAWIDVGVEVPFKSILVPLDGSDLASKALKVAERYALAFESTIHVVRVVNFLYGGTFTVEGDYTPDLFDKINEGAQEHVQEEAAKLDPRIRSVSETLIGDPATQLEAYVKNRGIDLVVMTTHGRSGFSRTALGSVADRMLAEAAAPVLVVRAEK